MGSPSVVWIENVTSWCLVPVCRLDMRLLNKLRVWFVFHHAVPVRLGWGGYLLLWGLVEAVSALVACSVRLELRHAEGVLVDAFPDRLLAFPLDHLEFLLVFLNFLFEQLLVVLDCLKLILNWRKPIGGILEDVFASWGLRWVVRLTHLRGESLFRTYALSRDVHVRYSGMLRSRVVLRISKISC